MRRYYTVLCEDLQAAVFVRRVLLSCGVQPRDIRLRPYPDNRFNAMGGGSPRRIDGYMVYSCGSQHVRENFAGELLSMRTQQNMGRDVALVVHIDVDNDTQAGRTVQDRQRELDHACTGAQPPVPVRTREESVAWLIPRRAIETWIHLFLSGGPVDESTSYPHMTGHEADTGPAASEFARHARAGTSPPHAPPSLVLGLDELRRVI
jgi:hypothetical protein